MEEIDGIIIDSLRNLHCDIEEDVTSLKHFDANLIVMAISSCLEAIISETSFPKKLPPSMSHKLKITSTLAEQIKELGFREDIGYQTILYCNEAEIRRVLMFLIERLPRESSKTSHVEQTGYVPSLVKEIENKIKTSLEQLWVPSSILNNGYRETETGHIFHSFGHCRPLRTRKLQIPQNSDSNNEALKQYWIHNVPEVTKQCNHRELIPSLLFNDTSISSENTQLRNCLFTVPAVKDEELAPVLANKSELIQTKLATKPEITHPKPENKMQSAVHKLNVLKAKYSELQETVKNYEMQMSQCKNILKQEEEALHNSLNTLNLKSKAVTVVSKEENLNKLKDLVENGKNKLVQLAERWNEVQRPLLEEYQLLKNTLSNEDLKLQEQQAKLKKLEEIHHELTTNLQEKTQMEEQFRKKLEQINKNHNRSGYTRRILEIIGNIKKQDEEIQKILKDTKCVQREINNLTGQVDRSFTLSDELIFRDAKHDETARKSYKLLAQLRDECSDIIKAVTDLGSIERECRNLQEQIDTETAKENTVKLERVNKDLQEIRKENELLLKQTI